MCICGLAGTTPACGPVRTRGIFASTMQPTPDLPFTVVTAADGAVTVTLLPEAGLHPRITHADSYLWLRNFRDARGRAMSGRLVLDVGRLNGMNSLLIAWLFQLIQVGRPAAMEVIEANEQILDQLRRFHVDDFVRITRRELSSAARVAVA